RRRTGDPGAAVRDGGPLQPAAEVAPPGRERGGGSSRSSISRPIEPGRRHTRSRMTQESTPEPEVHFSTQDLFDFPDPYPLFAGLRQGSPVLRVEQFRRETFMVTRYDDVAAVLRDNETFSSRSNEQLTEVMGRHII